MLIETHIYKSFFLRINQSSFAIFHFSLTKVRENRRKAKDSVELNAPLVEWIQSHSDALKSLQKVLGETRKIEDKQRRRMYVPRTKIVEEVIH